MSASGAAARPAMSRWSAAHARSTALAVAAFALLAALTDRLGQQLGEATDLYSRWYGLRQLLRFGVNPYGDEVTRAIAAHTPFLAATAGHAGPPVALETAFGFLYPLPGMLLLAPLALLPYRLALDAVLLLALLSLPVAAAVVAASARPERMGRVTSLTPAPRGGVCATESRPERMQGPIGLAAPALGLLFLPALANVLHAQLAPLVVLLVALAMWLGVAPRPPGRSRQRPAGAGACLAVAALLKPHLLLVLGPLWAGYHLARWLGMLHPTPDAFSVGKGSPSGQGGLGFGYAGIAGRSAVAATWQRANGRVSAKRAVQWDAARQASGAFVAGAFVAGAVLCGMAFALVPSWPADFARAARAYASLTPGADGIPAAAGAVLPGGSAVFVAVQAMVPAQAAWPVAAVLSVCLLAWAVAAWTGAGRGGTPAPAAIDGADEAPCAAGRGAAPGGDPLPAAGLPGGRAEVRAIVRTLVVTALVVPPAWETNAALLLVPLAAALGRAYARPRRAAALLVAAIAVSALDLPLYLRLPWYNGALLTWGYVLLLALAALVEDAAPLAGVTRDLRAGLRSRQTGRVL